MTLARPIPGIAEATSSDHADCGRLASNAILRVLGWNADDHAVDGATASQLMDSILALRLPDILLTMHTGLPMAVLAAGCYAVVGANVANVRGNNLELVNYDTGIRHWLAAYSPAGDYLDIWKNTYSSANLDASWHPGMNTLVIGRSGWVQPVARFVPRAPAEARAEVATMEGMSEAFIPIWNGTQHEFNLDQAGTLWHRWYGGAAGWNREALAAGLRPFGSVTVEVTPTQLHVWSTAPDGHMFHAWQGVNTGTWHPENIA